MFKVKSAVYVSSKKIEPMMTSNDKVCTQIGLNVVPTLEINYLTFRYIYKGIENSFLKPITQNLARLVEVFTMKCKTN